jgi:hypothetical protein
LIGGAGRKRTIYFHIILKSHYVAIPDDFGHRFRVKATKFSAVKTIRGGHFLDYGDILYGGKISVIANW